MKRALCLGLLFLVACAKDEHGDLFDDECDGHTDDLVRGRGLRAPGQALTVAGRWSIPASTQAIGDDQDVDYAAAPPYNGGDNCSGGATPGALFLRDQLLEYFDQIDSIGIYNCRVISGTNSMSLHGVGRALDVMISTQNGDADNGAGDPIGNWLIENAEAIGIQTIIWDHTIWRVIYDPRQHELSSGNPHIDHLHVELSPTAADMELGWYSNPFGPEPPLPCDPLPAEGGIVDEDSPCFDLHGPAQYWRSESGVGHDNALLWTNAFENDTPSNWAEWRIPVAESGDYAIDVYLDPAHAQFPFTKYRVNPGAGATDLVVDQGAASGWTPLGTFALSAGAEGRVKVFDHHESPVGEQKRIAVDALRLVRVVAAPSEGEGEGEGEPGGEGEGEEPPVEQPGEGEGEGEATPPEEEAKDPDADGPVLDADEPLAPDFEPSVSTDEGDGCSSTRAPLGLSLLLLGLARRRRGAGSPL